MLKIEAIGLRWLNNKDDDPTDVCVHGGLRITHQDRVLFEDNTQDWTLSSTALFLLRTLRRNHSPQSSVGGHLLPCCGHVMLEDAQSGDAVLLGCPNGIDWSVLHQDQNVIISFGDSNSTTLSKQQWVDAVVSFGHCVESFYEQSQPRTPLSPDEVDGYAAFRRELRQHLRSSPGAA